MGSNNIKAKIHVLTTEELEVRNAKIQKMIEWGCSYEDIGRRYGITPTTIQTLVKRGKIRKGIKDCFGHNNNLCRAMYVSD